MLLLLNILFYPVVDYVLPRGAQLTATNLLKAGAVVAVFVAVAVGHEAHSWEPNYFEVFNIPRTASSKEVRAVWKEMSKVTHPDVNPSPDAEEEFVKLTRAKDTLTGVSSRKVYDRWGPKFYESPHHDIWLTNPAVMAFIHLQEYGPLLFFTFISSIEVSRSRARWWCFALIAAMMYYELNLKYDDEDWDFLMLVLPQWTIHEKTQLLHFTAYFLINLAVNWARKTYVDMPDARFRQLAANQTEIARIVTELGAEVDDLNSSRKKSKEAGGAPVADGKELQRKAKVNKFKSIKHADENAAAAQQQQQQVGGGVQWFNLVILLLTIYSQYR